MTACLPRFSATLPDAPAYVVSNFGGALNLPLRGIVAGTPELAAFTCTAAACFGERFSVGGQTSPRGGGGGDRFCLMLDGRLDGIVFVNLNTGFSMLAAWMSSASWRLLATKI